MTDREPPPPGRDADTSLLSRISRDRDRDAFAALFNLYAPRLKAWFRGA